MFNELNPPYSTIVADPPWQYDERIIEYNRGAARETPGGRRVKGTSRPELSPLAANLPYSTMSNEDIAALPVVDIAAPGAHLYLWTTNQHLWAARDIALGWGFEPVQVLVWCKPPMGLGPGGVFSITTEFVVYARRTIKAARAVERAGALIREARETAGINRSEFHRLVRGGNPTGIVARWEDDDSLPNERDWQRIQEVLPTLAGVHRPHVPPPLPKEQSRIDSTWFQWARGRHSEKPPAFLDIVEQVSPGPYVELFARQPRLGWDSWGYGYEGAA